MGRRNLGFDWILIYALMGPLLNPGGHVSSLIWALMGRASMRPLGTLVHGPHDGPWGLPWTGP